MNTNIKRLLKAVLLLFAGAVAVYAAPLPPRWVINPQAQQCARVIPGDECGDIVLPAGWEYQDASSGASCPAGYTEVELRPGWTHFKAQFCCSEGHSGSPGDCQDVVIQPLARQCAFVEDM
jgi:hypothetical protein